MDLKTLLDNLHNEVSCSLYMCDTSVNKSYQDIEIGIVLTRAM